MTVQTNKTRNQPQLELFQKYLGLNIVGCQSIFIFHIQGDEMKFVFTLIDKQNPQRPFSFIVNVQEKDYRGILIF